MYKKIIIENLLSVSPTLLELEYFREPQADNSDLSVENISASYKLVKKPVFFIILKNQQ